MKFILLAFFVAAAFCENKWVSVAPFSTEDVVVLHKNNIDFRGLYDNMALLVLSPAEFSIVSNLFPSSVLSKLASYHQDQPFIYLEYTEMVDPVISVEKWLSVVETIASVENLDIVVSQKSRVFIHLNNPLQHVKINFPFVTEIVTVPSQTIIPVPQEKLNRFTILKNQIPQNKDAISELLDMVEEDQLRFWLEYLSGEDSSSDLYTRNSFSEDILEACDWAKEQFENYGFNVSIEYFQASYGPNVIATKIGSEDPSEFVVVGAHIDSRTVDRNSPTDRAPGANDDGSGTAALLEFARIIHESGVQLKKSLVLGAWNGEEQGLVGSRAYAAKSRDENLDIIAMLQGDMLAYRRAGENYQCAFPDRVQTPELTELAMSVVNTYIPELDTCYTSACCSDHQSFIENGYPATQFFERCGSIADDQYHRSGDLVNRDGFDMRQEYYNTKAMIASALTIAEPL